MKTTDTVPNPISNNCLCPLELMPVEAKFKFDEILKDFAEGRIVAPADGSQHGILKDFFNEYGGR